MKVFIGVFRHVSRVEWAASFYELWSKAGATPTYRVDNPENYISGFNWLTVWIENYFFNKVSDTIVGLILAVLIFFYHFQTKKKLSLKLFESIK